MPRVKRGLSGLSLVVGVNKPAGMSSHDVVNRCRSIFGERRVGHTGTLDPMATGVLPICVGPATRLGAYLTGHDKRYRVSIAFGWIRSSLPHSWRASWADASRCRRRTRPSR